MQDPQREGDTRPPAEPLRDLVVDPSRREVRWGNDVFRPSRRDFELLFCLAQQPVRAWSFEELLREVWNDPYGRNHEVVHAAVRRLRQHLRRRRAPVIIQSVHSFGFILMDDPSADAA